MAKLVSLSERVYQLNIDWDLTKIGSNGFVDKLNSYNNFLKTDLLSNYTSEGKKYHYLNRFVPCDLEGNVTEKPYEGMFEIQANEKSSGWAYLKKDPEHSEDHRYYDKRAFSEAMKTYQDTLNKVWFEGFELKIHKGSKDNHLELIWSTDAGKIFFSKDVGSKKWFPQNPEIKDISDLTDLNLTLTPFGAKLAGI